MSLNDRVIQIFNEWFLKQHGLLPDQAIQRIEELEAQLKGTVTTKYHDDLVQQWHEEVVSLKTKLEDLEQEYGLLLAHTNVLSSSKDVG